MTGVEAILYFMILGGINHPAEPVSIKNSTECHIETYDKGYWRVHVETKGCEKAKQ